MRRRREVWTRATWPRSYTTWRGTIFEDAQGDKDLVWTRTSQARVNVASTLSFIVLIASGSCAMATAGLLVAAQVTTSTP